MMTLAGCSILVGIIHLVLNVPLLVFPVRGQKVIKAFPRHEWAGRILAAVGVVWSVLLVLEMPLGWFDAYKGWLYAVGPVLYLLIVVFMGDLLAARALGGLLLLVADPVLETAILQPATLRLVLVVLAYVWVVAGMALMLAPYRFRKAAEGCCGTAGRCRVVGALGAMLGTGLIGLGLWVF